MLLRALGALSAAISCHLQDLADASAETSAAAEANRVAEIETAAEAEARHIEAEATNAWRAETAIITNLWSTKRTPLVVCRCGDCGCVPKSTTYN